MKHFKLKAWISAFFLCLVIFSPHILYPQTAVRTEIQIPDIPGYRTLKCDFHMHTVFSDGNVWPPIRAQEAWLDGLDAFAITDHIEYQPHSDDIPTNLNRSYELAKPYADAVGLTIIRGAEITRDEPPGHLDALFLNDIDPLKTEDYQDAVKAAIEQGGFVFWNHPGWKQPNRKAVWYDTQEELYQKGWLHGAEVVNTTTYYPNVHQWCLDKKLTMLGNSDIHNPVEMNYDPDLGQHRPITLVFAKDNSIESIKQALQSRRTAIYWENTLIGEEKYLAPIFRRSVSLKNPELTLTGTRTAYLQITNTSDVSYELVADGTVANLSMPDQVKLYAGKTVIFGIRCTAKDQSGRQQVQLPYRVKNLWVAPKQGLPVTLDIQIRFVPAGS